MYRNMPYLTVVQYLSSTTLGTSLRFSVQLPKKIPRVITPKDRKAIANMQHVVLKIKLNIASTEPLSLGHKNTAYILIFLNCSNKLFTRPTLFICEAEMERWISL